MRSDFIEAQSACKPSLQAHVQQFLFGMMAFISDDDGKNAFQAHLRKPALRQPWVKFRGIGNMARLQFASYQNE
jgi:hypothetical protein